MTPIERLIDAVEMTPLDCDMPPVDDGIPYVTHEGVLSIGGCELKVYRLNTGERFFDAESVERFFGGLDVGEEP